MTALCDSTAQTTYENTGVIIFMLIFFSQYKQRIEKFSGNKRKQNKQSNQKTKQNKTKNKQKIKQNKIKQKPVEQLT